MNNNDIDVYLSYNFLKQNFLRKLNSGNDSEKKFHFIHLILCLSCLRLIPDRCWCGIWIVF